MIKHIKLVFLALTLVLLLAPDIARAADTARPAEQVSSDYFLCVRPYQWTTDDPPQMEYWTAVDSQQAHGWLDLRRSNQKVDGPVQQGWSLVSYKVPNLCRGADVLLDLGDNVDRIMTAQEVSTLRAAIELKSDVQLERTTVGGIFFELKTDKASTDRTTGLWPAKADSTGQVNVRIPGAGVVGTTNARDNLLVQVHLIEAFHQHYIKVRDNYGFQAPEQLMKQTSATMQQLGTTYFETVPPRYVMDGWLPHATRARDNFDSPADPCDGGLNWTEVDGDWDPGTVNCSLESDDSAFNSLLSDASLANTDQQCTVEVDTLTTPGGSAAVLAGCALRFSSDADPGEDWVAVFLQDADSGGGIDQLRVFELINSSQTEIGASTSVTISLPDVVRLRIQGSELWSYFGTDINSLAVVHEAETQTDAETDNETGVGLAGRIVADGDPGNVELDSVDFVDLPRGPF